MQPAEQPTKQSTRRGRGEGRPWRPGQSGNPVGKYSKAAHQARRDQIVADWAEPIGGVASLNRAELDLLRQAAELQMKHHRTSEEMTRAVNTISKIMAQVGLVDKRRRRELPSPPSLGDYVARKVAQRDGKAE